LQPLKQSGWLQLEYGATHICRPAIWARLAEKLRRKATVDSAIPIDWAISELETLERGDESPRGLVTPSKVLQGV
jgi:hypothetical protein